MTATRDPGKDYSVPVDRPLLGRVLAGSAPARPLPEDVADLLRQLHTPPRLAAHLRAVHDVAWQLTEAIAELYPALSFNQDEVLFGAATHDIGKTIHPSELSQPGTRHEQAGRELLIESGVEARLARFAANHGTWTAPDISIEDLLVSLADKIWKAKRVPDLEDRIVQRICDASGEPRWQEFMKLDDLLDRLARDADIRLAFQNQYPATTIGGRDTAVGETVTRPLLFLDVDGTLLPFSGIGQDGRDGSNPLVAGLDLEHGRRLSALSCELVWATTWAAEANEVLAPRLGLTQLPVVDWPDDDDDNGRLHWKTRDLVAWAASRPFIWVDDEISDTDRIWVAANYSAPALLHRVDPRYGLVETDYRAIIEWLHANELTAYPLKARW